MPCVAVGGSKSSLGDIPCQDLGALHAVVSKKGIGNGLIRGENKPARRVLMAQRGAYEVPL